MRHRLPTFTSSYGFVPAQMMVPINFNDADAAAKTLVDIYATAEHPVLAVITPEVVTAFNAATANVITVGASDDQGLNNILSSSDVTEGTVGVGTAKRFVFRTRTKLIGSATGNIAVGTLTFTANAANTNTVTIGSQVYTLQTTLTNVANNVLIGTAATDSIDNLIAAINRDPAGAGTLYAAATVVHPQVYAAAGAGDTMTTTAKAGGTVGNAIATTDTLASTSAFGAATLTGGTDPTAGAANIFIELTAF